MLKSLVKIVLNSLLGRKTGRLVQELPPSTVLVDHGATYVSVVYSRS